MIIKKARIRSLSQHAGFIQEGRTVVFGCRVSHISDSIVRRIGFPQTLSIGQKVLPAPVFGPISRYNAEGKYKIHKDRPMETAYRQVEWHWQEWRGRYDREDQYKIVDVPYKRYPRTFIPPPSIELTMGQVADGESALVSPAIKLIPQNEELALHTINLFLEITGECEVFSENLEGIFKAPVQRLNWEILPPGRHPWAQLKPKVDELLHGVPKGNQTVIQYRLEKINNYDPEFLAIGRAGFRGYVIFGFPAKNLYILESIYFGNATYVFAEEWEELSKKTKAEILEASLQEDRIIHREGWDNKVHMLLKPKS
jgi:hypothetical protein